MQKLGTRSLAVLAIIALGVIISAEPLASRELRTRTVHVKAMKFEFVPNRVTVRKGQTLKLEIISADVEHSFRISTLGLNYPIEPGKTTEVVLTPAFTEQLRADCGKFCGAGHKEMNFTIEVEP